MPQVLKDEVRHAIERGALEVFARDGYGAATMASIAEAAGVSTGNVYRYHAGKERLFAAVVPDAFARKLTAMPGRTNNELMFSYHKRSRPCPTSSSSPAPPASSAPPSGAEALLETDAAHRAPAAVLVTAGLGGVAIGGTW